MFEKIVLATDLSPAWDEIVACAGEFKALGGSEVILAHVITIKFLGGLEAIWRKDAEPKLEEQRHRLEAQGLKATVEMPLGLPAYSLNEIARRYRADLIVVGSHGKSLWREGVLGCVSCAILHHTEFPTLLLNVRIKTDRAVGTCRLHATELLRHVLFPTDFSEIAQRAFEYLDRLAPRGVNQATLLHALEGVAGMPYPPGFEETTEAEARESLAALAGRLKTAGVPLVNIRLCGKSHRRDPQRHAGPGLFPGGDGHPRERLHQGDFSGKRGSQCLPSSCVPGSVDSAALPMKVG